jgi:hypothetical protein
LTSPRRPAVLLDLTLESIPGATRQCAAQLREHRPPFVHQPLLYLGSRQDVARWSEVQIGAAPKTS